MYKHVLHIILFGGEGFVAEGALVRLFFSLAAACAMSTLGLLVLNLGRKWRQSSLGNRHKLSLLSSQRLGQTEEERFRTSPCCLRSEEGRKIGIAGCSNDLGITGQC